MEWSACIPLGSISILTVDGKPFKADTDVGERGGQIGFNRCNASTEGQSSLCQTSFLNSVDGTIFVSCHLMLFNGMNAIRLLLVGPPKSKFIRRRRRRRNGCMVHKTRSWNTRHSIRRYNRGSIHQDARLCPGCWLHRSNQD